MIKRTVCYPYRDLSDLPFSAPLKKISFQTKIGLLATTAATAKAAVNMSGLYLPLTNLILAANHLSVNLTLEVLTTERIERPTFRSGVERATIAPSSQREGAGPLAVITPLARLSTALCGV
ncbi:unnamed protein product [Caenorhabditis auriculariae]|uniref:Uncharacterized protein n=1 Tax=Caenorhabditis auriculariae TaxID=2777116 RepID=A0A8S1GZR6_9PELO|nr:unnamed protein product [Caenorhabditis auriculariae]